MANIFEKNDRDASYKKKQNKASNRFSIIDQKQANILWFKGLISYFIKDLSNDNHS